MKRYLILLAIFLFTSPGYTADLRGKIKKLNWEGIEVIWLKDERFPTYSVNFYFADGSLSDVSSRRGETNAMFSLIDTGTRRFNRKLINDALDYYGVRRSASVYHEFSSYSVSGLLKDIIPTMKKICHLFDDAVFPRREIKKELARLKNSLNNMVAAPGSLANRAFREISLQGTPYGYPSGGKLKDLKNINQRGLRTKLKYFNEKVKKKIYLAGPSGVLNIKKIINEECGWTQKTGSFVRNVSYKTKKVKGPQFYLITVPNANQAHIRIGRFLNYNEIGDEELMTLSSGFLGGGFTSRLMREVRVKRGLTYGISAFASRQKDYGRSGIYTSTKNSSVKELIEVVQNTIGYTSKGDFKLEILKRAQGHLAGGHFFRFENLEAYLGQLLYFDHIGRPYDDLFKFAERIEAMSKDQV
ncbi:MAG: insulinase family protein, partial [Deltaproteobacteria bacterium]